MFINKPTHAQSLTYYSGYRLDEKIGWKFPHIIYGWKGFHMGKKWKLKKKILDVWTTNYIQIMDENLPHGCKKWKIEIKCWQGWINAALSLEKK